MPMHVAIILAAGYSGIGFVVYFNKGIFSGARTKVIYLLIIFHLLLSAILHAFSIISGSNQWITIFPDWYPYLAVVYFAVFGCYCLKAGNLAANLSAGNLA